MPDELKISRNYHEALRRIGIKNPGEVNVGVPVQLVAAVDSLAHLSPPVVVPIAGYGDPSGPHVGEAEIPVEYEARAGGLWCLYAETSSSSDVVLYCGPVSLITAGVGIVVIPGLQSPADGSVPLVSIIRHGRTAVAAPFGITLDVGQSFSTPFYVPPAHFVGLQCLTQNQFVRASMMVQEVPLRAPGAE